MLALEGVRIVDLSWNIPGPVASARLAEWGAEVLKVEPPQGDPLARVAPSWYRQLNGRKEVLQLDLKSRQGRRHLHRRLDEAHLLITSMRPSALTRLGLEWQTLHRRYPLLNQVAIVGQRPPEAEQPGHDLTYQAAAGLLRPPALPLTLLADLAGAERAVSCSLLLLREAEKTGRGRLAWVSLQEAAWAFAEPLRQGLTSPSGRLGGASARYRLYACRDGWVAVAALEDRLWEELLRAVGVEPGGEAAEEETRRQLEEIFRSQECGYWEELARRYGLCLKSLP